MSPAPTKETKPRLDEDADSNNYINVNSTDSDKRCSARSARANTKNRYAIQRSLGSKNIVIYLLFLNFVLLTGLVSTYYSSHQQLLQQQQQQFSAFSDEEKPEHKGEAATSVDFWLKMALIVLLVMVGGVCAGLTIGLMGLDETNLHVLMASGTPKEQVHAETVYSLLSRGKHWVLVTLLLGNVIVNETLPVVLDSELGGGVVAILISTMLIVIFGEIIPQAVCARYGLAIGAYCTKPMMIFMYLMSPIAYPISLLLDSWLGVHHGTTYRRTELKTLVSLHQVDGIGELTDDEVTIIASVLDLKEKYVEQVMTPFEDVFTLSEDAILDEVLMEEIVSAGYSRIPIYRHDDPNNFIGMLLVKRLITYDPEDHIPVRQFTINTLPEVPPNTSCLDILNFFQEGRSHMAMVVPEPGGFGEPVGVITLEDVIEELLGEEIVDESDVYVDVHKKIKVIRKPNRNTSIIKNLKNLLQSPALSNAATPLLGSNTTFVSGVPTGSGGAEAAATGAPIEGQNHYMTSGKLILQSRKTSADIGSERQPLLDGHGHRYECAFKTEPSLYFKEGHHSPVSHKGASAGPSFPPVIEVDPMDPNPNSPRSTISAGAISNTTAATSGGDLTGTGSGTPATLPATLSPVPTGARSSEQVASPSTAPMISHQQPSASTAESRLDGLERIDGVTPHLVDEAMSPAPSQKKKKKKSGK
ncbi:hypothetical protein BGZ65_009479 [Modicella reniformis]|uniref:DUF21-domain-containing protein n=1 Tax=Modicella reniformis TaxID=1440133 RepID=A0A9P6J4H2_9FUNG|nr:hypothetical protein BGZ65_009479 [Modicella reniformis]